MADTDPAPASATVEPATMEQTTQVVPQPVTPSKRRTFIEPTTSTTKRHKTTKEDQDRAARKFAKAEKRRLRQHCLEMGDDSGEVEDTPIAKRGMKDCKSTPQIECHGNVPCNDNISTNI